MSRRFLEDERDLDEPGLDLDHELFEPTVDTWLSEVDGLDGDDGVSSASVERL